tara:strand:- start:10069 stop:10230 length:162 start_codon:yes stop_codon:yes gene_type:complete
MSFRVVDNETNEVLLDTNKIDVLVDYLERMEYDEDRPMIAMTVHTAEGFNGNK